MKPRFDSAELRKTTAKQYFERFVFGGTVTVITGLFAHAWGPMIGGLFLAFPAVLPVSLTHVKDEDGRKAAVEDARGARIGALGLLCFGMVACFGAGRWSAAIALLAALLGWALVSTAVWAFATRSDREPGSP
jgi:hypothetical protein